MNEFIESMLKTMKLFLFIQKPEFFLFERSLLRCDSGFQFLVAQIFSFRFYVQIFIGDIETFQRRLGKLDA